MHSKGRFGTSVTSGEKEGIWQQREPRPPAERAEGQPQILIREKEDYQQVYANKFNDSDQMDKSLERCQLRIEIQTSPYQLNTGIHNLKLSLVHSTNH